MVYFQVGGRLGQYPPHEGMDFGGRAAVSQQSGFVRPGDGVTRVRRTRIERLRHADAWGVSDTVEQVAALRAVGFEPVGQVYGASVQHVAGVSRSTPPSCTYQAVDLADALAGVAALQTCQLYDARRDVLRWATAECHALGGDGIIGVRMQVSPHPAQGTQFIVEATAVQARSRVRSPKPFTTHLSGPDFARLLGGGWMPVSVVFGLAAGSEHDDANTRLETAGTRHRGKPRGAVLHTVDERHPVRRTGTVGG
jgi:uncharacterized protein YbjQ (UPF0145 family)